MEEHDDLEVEERESESEREGAASRTTPGGAGPLHDGAQRCGQINDLASRQALNFLSAAETT